MRKEKSKIRRPKPAATGTDMAELFGLYRLNSETFTIFVDFSGHVNTIAIRAHFGGWKLNSYPTGTWDVTLNGDAKTHNQIQTTIQEVKDHANGLPFPGKAELDERIKRAKQIKQQEGAAV